MDKEKLELTELGLNIRHWENLRWVAMTVFIAIMGGIAAAILGAGGIQIPKHLNIFTKIAGLLFVVIFWIQDERIVAYWRTFRARAIIVESTIGIAVFSSNPKRGVFSAGTAVRILYISFLVAWILVLAL